MRLIRDPLMKVEDVVVPYWFRLGPVVGFKEIDAQ